MERDELEQKLEGLTTPDPENDVHKRKLLLTLLNARRTAWWGAVLVIIPALFLLGVFLKYALGIGFLFDPLDKYLFDPIVHGRNTRFLEPLLLFLIPLLVLVLNVISITHFSMQGAVGERELVIAIKKRWWNWLVITISGAILVVIFLYAIRGDK